MVVKRILCALASQLALHSQVFVQGAPRRLAVSEQAEDRLTKEKLAIRPHSLETEDGYVLTLLHLTSRDATLPEPTQGVVLLQHGISMDGLSWFETATEAESLPSLLVKAGFDVWLGNDRGTKNS